jgi:hypothetical protein
MQVQYSKIGRREAGRSRGEGVVFAPALALLFYDHGVQILPVKSTLSAERPFVASPKKEIHVH